MLLDIVAELTVFIIIQFIIFRVLCRVALPDYIANDLENPAGSIQGRSPQVQLGLFLHP